MKRVVLVRTEGPRNAGMAARAVANFGPAELCFVAPARADLLSDREFLLGAHGVTCDARRYEVFDALDAALAPCTHVVGFTARFRQHRQLRAWPEIVEELHERCAAANERVALVFGNEAYGLSEQEAARAQELVWIPTTTVHTSLNVAVAVSIVLAGLFEGGRRLAPSRKGRPLTQEERVFLIRHLEAALCARVHSAAGRRDLEASIRRVFAQAPLESRDARAWHRLLRALGSRARPDDLGLDEPRKPPRRR